jgi:hypothetical protein
MCRYFLPLFLLVPLSASTTCENEVAIAIAVSSSMLEKYTNIVVKVGVACSTWATTEKVCFESSPEYMGNVAGINEHFVGMNGAGSSLEFLYQMKRNVLLAEQIHLSFIRGLRVVYNFASIRGTRSLIDPTFYEILSPNIFALERARSELAYARCVAKLGLTSQPDRLLRVGPVGEEE